MHPSAVEIALDIAEQMRPLASDLDQAGAIGAGRNRRVERIECRSPVRIAGPPRSSYGDTDYEHILFRSAGASEIAAWSSLDTNTEVVAGIEHSPEVLTYVDPLIRLYQGAFDRAPEVSGLSANVNIMRDGHHSINDMANAFVHSSEFINAYGSLTDAKYVEQLYHNVLGRVGSLAEVNAGLATGSDRAHILVGFTESSEFINSSATGVQHYLDQLAAG